MSSFPNLLDHLSYFTKDSLEMILRLVGFEVSGVVAGWAAALQLMRMGERWMLYIPYQSGYGINDYTAPYSTNTIPGGSLLTFDLQLVSFAE